MRQMHIILLVAFLQTALSIQTGVDALRNFNFEENQDVRDVIQNLMDVMSLKDEPSFDVNDETDMLELRRIIADRGFNPHRVLSDFTFLKTLSAVSGIFKSGNARRWTTVNFGYQLACYQGVGGNMFTKGVWAFAKYNGYACYCGSGDYSGNYLDGTDHCCKIHDQCYEGVQKKYKLSVGCQTYTIPYSVSCCNDQKITKCTDKGPSAGRELCECDQAMSSCVAKHTSTYNKAYHDNRSKCSSGTKSQSAWEVLKSCRDIFKPQVTFPTEYGSQGSCPAQKKKGWWWGKKKDQE